MPKPRRRVSFYRTNRSAPFNPEAPPKRQLQIPVGERDRFGRALRDFRTRRPNYVARDLLEFAANWLEQNGLDHKDITVKGLESFMGPAPRRGELQTNPSAVGDATRGAEARVNSKPTANYRVDTASRRKRTRRKRKSGPAPEPKRTAESSKPHQKKSLPVRLGLDGRPARAAWSGVDIIVEWDAAHIGAVREIELCDDDDVQKTVRLTGGATRHRFKFPPEAVRTVTIRCANQQGTTEHAVHVEGRRDIPSAKNSSQAASRKNVGAADASKSAIKKDERYGKPRNDKG